MGAAIDLDHLERQTMSDQGLRAEVLEIFRDQAAAFDAALASELTDEEWRDLMHGMKGAARGVGAFTLGTVCDIAEKLVGPGAAPRREEAIADIRVAVAAATSAAADAA